MEQPAAPLAPDLGSRPLHEDPAIHARRWFLLAMMCLSLVLVVMSVSGLVTAIPRMQEELSATASQIQWIMDAYAIVFAGSLLMAGALGDRFGRKKALLAGLVVFGGGAIFAGLASAAAQVIIGRGLMGIGAALVMPATLSIITTIFPPEERSKAIAVWAGFAGAGGAIGPIVSGGLLERFWWGAAVLVNLPLVVVTFVAILRFAPESRDEDETPLDPLGAMLSLAGLSALVFAIIQGGENGWSSVSVLLSAVVAVAALGGLLWWEQRTPHPMLPLTFFRDRRFSVGSGVVTLAFFVMFGFFFIVTQFLQFGRGYSPLLAGAAILPMAATAMLVSPRSAALAERYGSGPTMVVGFALMAAGFVVLAGVTVSAPWVVVIGASVLLAVGMSLTMAPATGSIMNAVPIHRAGIGSAVNDVTRELGSALGIAVLGTIVNATYRSRVDLAGVGIPPEAAHAAGESVGTGQAGGRGIRRRVQSRQRGVCRDGRDRRRRGGHHPEPAQGARRGCGRARPDLVARIAAHLNGKSRPVRTGSACDVVGLPRFELGTSCPPDKRANQAAPQPVLMCAAASLSRAGSVRPLLFQPRATTHQRSTRELVGLSPRLDPHWAQLVHGVGRRTHQYGLWRSLVSALVWGTRGPEFKSRQPDHSDQDFPVLVASRQGSGSTQAATALAPTPAARILQ